MGNKKIAIIGHFGGDEDFLDGQTIKTKILYEEVLRVTCWKIKKVDTYYKERKPLKLVIQTISALFFTRDIIVLLSGNGMRFYFPILYMASKILGTRIYHDVIGGNQDTYVDRYPTFKKYLNEFHVNWVETENLKKRLEARGIGNCEVIPNFKRLNIAEPVPVEFSEPFCLCMLSSVMREKGIETAIEAIEAISHDAGKEISRWDIIGLIDDGYQEQFEQIMKTVSSSVRYMGTVSYEKSVEAIKDYYALLFPTFWDGEGFPGTIVDAFSAGLPVIASNWSCNGEIISDKRNGVLYPNEDYGTLTEAIKWLIMDTSSINQMKKLCVNDAATYQPDNYIKIITKTIGRYLCH